ncbi:MAG TPA: lysophospholipid acyltransferase family protein, partial [Chloroflexota bacterium]|nr:lysophospholipid acyltransferase family protein [Chloroflexota bacterium]
GQIVSFCGRPARMPIAAAVLARRTGAPLLPVGNWRLPNGGFRCRVGPPIPLSASDGRRLSIVEITERLLAALEPFLRENPTQWVVFRRVWEDGCG